MFRRKISSALVLSLLAGLAALQTPSSGVSAVAGQWEALGSGVDGGTRGQVMDIALDSAGNVYVGGWFDYAKQTNGSVVNNTAYVAEFDGTNWSALGTGGNSSVDYGVCSIELDQTTNPTRMYVGGDFGSIGGQNTDYAAYVTLATNVWSAIDLGTRQAEYCPEEILAVGPQDILMVGGKEFGHSYAIHYNATTSAVTSLGGGFNSRVFGLTSDGTNIYATGQFTSTSATPQLRVNGVAKSSIASPSWSGLGANATTSAFPECASASKYCTEIAVDGSGKVYVAGNFTKARNNGVDAANSANLAVWDGTAWSGLGSITGNNPVVEEVKVWGGYVYIGGRFNCVNDLRVNNLARYKIADGTWEAVGDGVRAGVSLDSSPWSAVRSIESRDNGGTLYIGGSFENAGTIDAADNIAKLTPANTQAGPCNLSSLVTETRDVLAFDGPKNFRFTSIGYLGKLPGYNNGEEGRLIEFAWDAPTGVDYYIYKVSASRITKRDAKGKVAESEPLPSSYDCWSVGLTCQIVISKDDPYVKDETLLFNLRGFTFSGVGKPSLLPYPSPYDPVYPADPPSNVTAVAGWNSVTVSWKPPANTGTYPITYYLVTAYPGGRSCLSKFTDPVFTQCVHTGLTPGTKYTFTVQALTGAGWSEESEASTTPVTPQNVKITSTARNRARFLFINRGSDVEVGGIAPGYPAGTTLKVWVKYGDSTQWQPLGDVKVSRFGTFSWKRRFPTSQDRTPILITFTQGNYQSNTVKLAAVS